MQDIIKRLRAKKDDEGFTLIELLVVVVIIGVLVAIAVPVYLNYRAGAADKSAQSDVRGAISAIEQYYTDNNNTYPAAANGDNTAGNTPQISVGTQRITLSDKTILYYAYTTSATSYKICARNAGGTAGKWYLYDSALGGSVKAMATAPSTPASCA
jgi:type IV pilus assembly protein PilA